MTDGRNAIEQELVPTPGCWPYRDKLSVLFSKQSVQTQYFPRLEAPE